MIVRTVIVALLIARVAAASPEDCAAIPDASARKDCEAKAKDAEAACKKPMTCDEDADLTSQLGKLRKTRADMVDVDQKATADSHRKSTEGQKDKNEAAVQRAQADIDADNAKYRQLSDKADKQSEAFRQSLSDRLSNARDCLNARADVAQSLSDAMMKVLSDVTDDTRDKVTPVGEQLYAAIGKQAPKPELLQQMHACEDARTRPLEYETGNPVRTGGCIGAGSYTGKLQFGTPLHKAQRWCDYQARYPEDYPNQTDKMEAWWSEAYDRVVANKENGKVFERAAIAKLADNDFGVAVFRNSLEMIKDKRVKSSCVKGLDGGFIPDGLWGDTTTELKWGEPYNFIEVKNRNEVGYTGNVKLMVDYVDKCGGTLTLVIREPGANGGSGSHITGKWNDPAHAKQAGLAPQIQKLMEAKKMWVVEYPE